LIVGRTPIHPGEHSADELAAVGLLRPAEKKIGERVAGFPVLGQQTLTTA